MLGLTLKSCRKHPARPLKLSNDEPAHYLAGVNLETTGSVTNLSLMSPKKA